MTRETINVKSRCQLLKFMNRHVFINLKRQLKEAKKVCRKTQTQNPHRYSVSERVWLLAFFLFYSRIKKYQPTVRYAKCEQFLLWNNKNLILPIVFVCPFIIYFMCIKIESLIYCQFDIISLLTILCKDPFFLFNRICSCQISYPNQTKLWNQ